MIVGQEWGGANNYEKQCGCDRDGDSTNQNLTALIRSIGRQIEAPSIHQKKEHKPAQYHYFTNAILCLRLGNATQSNGSGKGSKTPSKNCFVNCGCRFLRPQIDLVKPRVVVTLGLMAHIAALEAYGMNPMRTMSEAFAHGMDTPVYLGDVRLISLYHCGRRGEMNRSMEQQIADWKLVQKSMST
jgi:uracil-DNA glycosylase